MHAAVHLSVHDGGTARARAAEDVDDVGVAASGSDGELRLSAERHVALDEHGGVVFAPEPLAQTSTGV